MAAERIQCLDGLRGLAATSIVLFHFNFAYLPGARIANLIPIGRAYLAVDLFFLLSGFILAHVYGEAMSDNWRATWRPFLIARFARLYPLFLVTLLFLVAIVGTGRVQSKYVHFGTDSLLLQPFMLQALHHGLNWNYPSWSIATEASAYVVFIFAARYLLRGRFAPAVAAICILIVATICWIKNGHLNVGSISGYVRTFAEFGLGVLLYRAYNSSRDLFRLCGILAFLPSCFLAWYSGYDVFATLAFAAAIAICVTTKGLIRTVLELPPCRALGNWSYGIYLWHAPVHFTVMVVFAAYGVKLSHLDRSLSLWLGAATLAFVITITAATYRWIEVPARRAVSTRLSRLSDNLLCCRGVNALE